LAATQKHITPMHSSLGIEILTPRGSVAKLVAPPHVSIRPVSIGTEADVEIHGEGIAPEHLFILLREGRLLATSAVAPDDPFSKMNLGRFGTVGSMKGMKPAMLLGPSFRLMLSSAWTTADLPCRVELGDVTVRLFWCSARKQLPPITSALPKTKTPLPPVRPPPKRPLPPHETLAERLRREEALLREDDTTAAARPENADAKTLDAAADAFDQDPTVKKKRVSLSDEYEIPTPAHQKLPLSPPQLSGRVTPLPPPPPRDAGLNPLPRVFVHTPPGGNPHPHFPPPPAQMKTESSLFKIATKAVDAWNRWVDDLETTNNKRR
jgi:hypothetical protein